MSSKFLNIEGLKESLDSQNPIRAREIVENVCKFFDQDLTSAELALASELLFHEHNGILAFANKSITQNKRFTGSNVLIFEVWAKLIRNFSKEISFGAYIDNILAICQRYILSTAVSAKEKEYATIVMQEVFQSGHISEMDISPLVVKLMNVLLSQKSKQTTFLQEVYKLLGTISHTSPSSILYGVGPEAMRDVFLKPLETILMNEETLQYNTLTGALQGLSLYLKSFAPSDAETCKRIYICMKRLSDPMDSTKKSTFRASIDLFTTHASLLSVCIFKDAPYWHSCLDKWLSSSIYDDRRKGIYGTHAFHNVIAAEILNRDDENDRDILRFFINYFRAKLETAGTPPYLVRIAIRGFAVMSAPCKRLLPDMLGELTLLVIQRSELVSIAEDNELRDTLEHFPDYVEALSQIITITEDRQAMEMLVQNVETITTRLIKDFHYLSRAHTQLVVSSMLKAFWNLTKVSGNLLDDVLDKVILSGIIWTCSHKLIYDAFLDWSTEIDWKDNITYKSYLPMWEGLIVDVEDTYNRALVAEKIFNGLIKNLFVIINKLDLRTKRRVYTEEDGTDKEFYFCDPNIDLCPVKPQDFHIFFNVVDFYKDLFWIKFRSTYFSPWIQEFCTTMLRLAVENPLVSGFLKLLEIGLVKAEYLHYFDDNLLLEVHTLRTHLQHFLKHLIVKCQKISGELQMSCLELILKYPGRFYDDYITTLIPIFEIALDIGKSTIWLAKLAVGALEKILERQSEDTPAMSKLFRRVLPCLDSYLGSKGFEGSHTSEIIKVGNKRRIRSTAMPKIHETELFALQRQIMALLGKLSPQTAMTLILDTKSSENFVKWEMEQSLRVILHFPTMRPSIYLDTIIPRICELAVKCSDRKTKVSACEMVHAVILYSMGTRRYKGQIWKELCRCMLTLGADSDGTVQQMFEPLLKQVMHYMSKYENLDGVEPLMEALMTGISNNGNSSIRDLSAVCIREFVEWSIRQVTAEQLAASAGSIGKILEHLKMYSFDSDGTKRNGAALAFNNLYRILRQQEAICDDYFIDLFYTFCVNFKLSEEMSSISLAEHVNSDLDQVSMSLDHVVRVLRERNDIFNKIQPKRLQPSVHELKTLKDVVVFLVREGGSKLLNYRLKCIGITKLLAVRVEQINTYTDFLNKYITVEDLKVVCEGERNGTGIKARPNLNFIRNEKNSPYTMIYSWLQHLLASLDCYCWLLGVETFANREKLFEGANIFNVISYYLSDICWEDIGEILNNIDSNISIDSAETIVQMNSEDSTKIATIKTLITVRTMDFMSKIHIAACASVVPRLYWTVNRAALKKFINQLVFEVHRLNFDFRVQNLSRALPTHINNFMEALNEHCTDRKFVAELQQSILNGFTLRLKNIHTSIEEILNSDSISDEQQNAVSGIQFVCENLEIFHANQEIRKFLKNTSMELFSDLFLKIQKIVLQETFAIEPCPAVNKLVNQLMSICFTVNNMAANVVHCLLDTTVLKANNAGTTITHGNHFLAVYKRTIFEFCNEEFIQNVICQLLRNITLLNFHQILNFLMKLIDNLHKTGSPNRSCLTAAIDYILANLSSIIQLVAKKNEQMTFTKLIAHLVNASPLELHTFSKKAPNLEAWILDQLRNNTISLKTKSNIIYLLPTVVGPDDNEHEALTKALEDVQRQYLPLQSREFAKNSSEETALKYVFKYLLHCLVMSRSYVILEFLIKCTASDSKHTIEWIIRDELKSYTFGLSVAQQCVQLNRILEVTCSRNIEPNFRLTILDRFLLTMIQSCSVESLNEFFTANIKRINELIETNYGSGKAGWVVEHALVDRIVGFSLIEVMFGCLPKEKLCTVDSSIGRQLLGQLKMGTEMVGIFTKKAFYSRSEVFVTDDVTTRELFRKYQCAAFRVVCSLVSNTQVDLQFYSKFIFEENRAKNDLIWAKLVDCTNDNLYSFDGQESEELLKIKERFTSIRRLNPRSSTSAMLTTHSSRQLQTQSVFQSSLSQDVVKLDLNYSKVRTDTETIIQREKLEGSITTVHLERTVLNKHEVMPTLCGVVEHMIENEIAPKPPPGGDRQRPYKWILAIASAMESTENHKNIRLFVAQFVQNCREVFKFYSYALFGPVLQVLVDECAGPGLNFFITDLVAMLLSWTSDNFYTPSTFDEKRSISQLVKFLMKNAWHQKRAIFKFNLELIQSVIAIWKDCISVPTQLLMDSISRTTSTSSSENGCGIVVLGLAMSSGLEIWTPATKETFVRNITMNLQNEHTAVYQSASTVLGMMLQKLRIENDDGYFENPFAELIQRIKNLQFKNEKKFMDIVYGIHKHFPEIVDSFREVLTFRIPLALGTIKSIYLEMFLTRMDSYDGSDLYKTLISIGISDILMSLDYQLLGLHILNRAIRKMDSTDLVALLPKVEECLDSRKSDCRDVAYEILIYLALNFTDETGSRASQFLLTGLMDPETTIQDRIFHFWSKETNLTAKIEERILFLISQYGAKCEKHFLGFCTQLLLQLSIENPESKRQVFEFQTDDDSKLMEYNINTVPNIKSTNTLPPLFAESHNTRRSLLLGSQSYSYVQDMTSNDYSFEPTLDPTKTRTLAESFSLPTQSDLLFMVAPQVLNRNSQKVQRLAATLAETNSPGKSADRLRRRFLKDKEKETRNRVLQIIDNRVKAKGRQTTDVKRKEGHVVLYRRYRNGDYPDLLINHLALLLPLQGLVRRDDVIAREVFVSIFTTVLDALGPEANMFIISISSQIQTILENVKLCDAMIFATFLEIALIQPAKFNFSPELVAMISKATNMLTSGAIYLESRINADWETDMLSIKSNSTVPIDEQHWLNLSEIYNSLAEYDLVSSIFADKMRTDPRLADAIDLRANGKYADAQTLLLEIIHRHIQMEHYYAYICYFDCFVELGDWSQLFENVQNQVDDFEELWTDDYNMSHFLPNLMQSELQLILQNKSKNDDFLRALESWTADPVKSEYIKRVFCQEMMMLHVANRDFLQARVYGESSLKAFLIDWSVISSMNSKLRLKNLLNAQIVAEIDHYALMLNENFNEASVAKLTSRWERCNIKEADSLRYWNCVVAYRTYIGHLLQDMLGNVVSNSEGLVSNELQSVLFRMHLQLFNAALAQKNSSISAKSLEQLGAINQCASHNFDLQYDIARIKQSTLENHTVSCLERAWTESVAILRDNERVESDIDLKVEMLNMQVDIGEQILKSLTPAAFHSIDELDGFTGDPSSVDELKRFFFERSLASLRQITDKLEIVSRPQKTLVSLASKNFYRLAQFCYDHREHDYIPSTVDMEEMMVKYVLLAMKYDSMEACQMFPSILQLPSLENQTLLDTFQSYATDVPEWMFLTWIPQILSRLNFDKSTHLDDIVRRLALSYPNALVCPFTVWYERYASEMKRTNKQVRLEIQEIVNIMHNPVAEMFIRNFKILCLPGALLLSHLEDMAKFINAKAALKQNDFVQKLKDIINAVFVENADLQGRAYRNIQIYKVQLASLQQMDVESDYETLHNRFGEIRNSLRNSMKNADKYIELSSISPWLANFHWCGEEAYLEFPGQYETGHRPKVFDHLKIVKFGQKIEVFTESLRKPLRITMHGSDGKSKDYLVKYGEDVKQDQRIQQILRLMSSKLAEDPQCRHHNLCVGTFQVTPMGQNCGMMSWVSDAISLERFVVKAFLRRNPNGVTVYREAMESYCNFIENASRDESGSAINSLDLYGKAVRHYTRNQLSANLRNLENEVPLEIIKMALVDMSVSPDSFYMLRNNFATSLAAMNISNWILGIGDRHLANIVISIKNATLTGVDFGYNFGCGVRNLPVPELTPFRLTSHLVGTMNPWGTSGVLSKCMCHALRVFRNSRRILMACMEVFIQEPTITWISSTRMQRMDIDGEMDTSDDSNWEPKDRIEVAELKLLGYNPVYLTEKELRAGLIGRYPEYLEAYVKLLQGDRQFNIRARLPKDDLTVEQQVKSLIDLATDTAVLGCAFRGFLPFL